MFTQSESRNLPAPNIQVTLEVLGWDVHNLSCGDLQRVLPLYGGVHLVRCVIRYRERNTWAVRAWRDCTLGVPTGHAGSLLSIWLVARSMVCARLADQPLYIESFEGFDTPSFACALPGASAPDDGIVCVEGVAYIPSLTSQALPIDMNDDGTVKHWVVK